MVARRPDGESEEAAVEAGAFRHPQQICGQDQDGEDDGAAEEEGAAEGGELFEDEGGAQGEGGDPVEDAAGPIFGGPIRRLFAPGHQREGEAADAEAEAEEDTLEDGVSTEVVEPPVVRLERGAEAGEHGADDPEEEGSRDPDEGVRGSAPGTFGREAPEDEAEHHRREDEPEGLGDGKLSEPGAEDEGDRADRPKGQLPDRGRIAVGASRDHGEEEPHRERRQEALHLRHRVEDGPKVGEEAEPVEEPVQDARPREQQAEREKQKIGIAAHAGRMVPDSGPFGQRFARA